MTSEQHLYKTIIQFDKTIVLPRNLASGSIHDYLFCNCSLVGILFEVLRIPSNNVFGVYFSVQSIIVLQNITKLLPGSDHLRPAMEEWAIRMAATETRTKSAKS